MQSSHRAAAALLLFLFALAGLLGGNDARASDSTSDADSTRLIAKGVIPVRVLSPDSLRPSGRGLINVRVASADEPRSVWRPLLGLRARQELLDGVFHFDPVEPGRNWIRLRSRAGLHWTPSARQSFELRLLNEFRKILEPDTELDLDEVVIDHLWWRRVWERNGRLYTLKIGRQDVIWDDGFLILEGHPLDGSRSMYQNALRFTLRKEGRELELLGIHNPKRDPLVLAGDEERALADANESAVALRVRGRDRWRLALIWKQETDFDNDRPMIKTWTLALRREADRGGGNSIIDELALQRQDGTAADGWALALRVLAEQQLSERWRGELGGFYYSGWQGGWSAFRTPWGRWPMWSELYIYTLIPEGGVATWQNIAAPHLSLRRQLFARRNRSVDLRLSAYLLLAPQSDFEMRGPLYQAELRFQLASHLSGHLLWEMLSPDGFHDDMDGPVHFLRWQLDYEIK